tara:strand:+ start:1526 stop:1807 length:282 start_codon:yes stop_codon:yes gene_type:complete
MDNKGKANHIEDYLAQLHTGQWFGWSDAKNKIYENLIILDDSKTKPSEADCTTGLKKLQDDFDAAETQKANDKISAQNKLKALGLTDAEIEAL